MRRLAPVIVALALVALVALVAAAGAGAWGRSGPERVVQPGASVAVVAAAHPGARIRLAPGIHPPFELAHRAVVRGGPGVTVGGGIRVTADGVRLQQLSVAGGENGVTVRGAQDVVLRDVEVTGATLHGIEVVDAAARIEGCAVRDLLSPYSQGIEIRNTNGRPRSQVVRCSIDGARDGIVAHVSRLEIVGNDVTGTTNKAIAVTEMSEAVVRANRVRGVQGVALFCGDYSRCDVRDNDVSAVVPAAGGVRSLSGRALVGWYHSTVRDAGNRFAVDARPALDVYLHSRLTDGSPLSRWPAGWRGARPAVPVTALAVGALVAGRVLLAPLSSRLRRRWDRRPVVEGVDRLGGFALGVIAAVQLFHVVEHGVQVFQVHVAGSEVRTGLVGARFDTEWLHLGFNTVVLGGTLAGLGLARPTLARRFGRLLPWLVAGVAIQCWHVVEHVARVTQHVRTGVRPAPGVIGDDLGLVWFHYGINVPILVALLAVVVPWSIEGMRSRAAPLSRRRAPAEGLVLPTR